VPEIAGKRFAGLLAAPPYSKKQDSGHLPYFGHRLDLLCDTSASLTAA
jgi:hypothetical protein